MNELDFWSNSPMTAFRQHERSDSIASALVVTALLASRQMSGAFCVLKMFVAGASALPMVLFSSKHSTPQLPRTE